MRLRHYILLLFSITFLTYLSSFWNQFVWDDEQFIYSNQYVKNFEISKIFSESTTSGSGIPGDYYRPFTTLSFALDTSIWGLNPTPFHINNTILHIAAGVLLCILLIELGFSRKNAFWFALLFLLHPLQTEAVSYINSRGDSLYVFFGLLSSISLVTVLKKKTYTLSLYNLQYTFSPLFFAVTTGILYIFAILSKEIALAILGINGLLVIYWYFMKNTKTLQTFFTSQLTAIAAVAGMIIAAVGYISLRATVLNFSNTFNLYNDGSIYSESIVVRLLTFCKVIWIYCSVILFPYNLHMERTTPIITSPLSFWLVLTIALLCGLVFIGVAEYIHKKTIFILFGTAWFFGMLVPVSGIIPINGILYEHWLYLPIVGFYITLFGLYQFLVTKHFKIILSQHIQIFLYAIVLLYMILIVRQNYFWSTPVRLYEYLLKHTESARIYTNLGMAYATEKNTAKAIAMYKKSIELSDQYPQTYHNLANTYRDSGNTTLAIENYQKALAVQPDFFFSYDPLFALLLKEKRYDEARSLIALIQTHFPNNPSVLRLENQLPKTE